MYTCTNTHHDEVELVPGVEFPVGIHRRGVRVVHSDEAHARVPVAGEEPYFYVCWSVVEEPGECVSIHPPMKEETESSSMHPSPRTLQPRVALFVPVPRDGALHQPYRHILPALFCFGGGGDACQRSPSYLIIRTQTGP